MSDTKLYLGDFAFEGFEIPDHIPLGGAQALVIHRFPGGARVIQSMGRDDLPIAWSGMFTGPTALERARYLDLLRVRGRALDLSFFEFSYRVVIRSFIFVLENFHRIPYTLELEVVSDNTQPQATFPPSGFETSLVEDSAAAVVLGGGIGDSALTGLLSTMDSAIRAVSDFAKATQATINTVLAPVSAVLLRVNVLVGTASNTINSVATVGGILPNTPIAQQAAKLSGQAAALAQLPQLYNLQSVATRIQTNLNLIGSGPNVRTVTAGGGTLFDVAAREYGDASKWDVIAKANNRTDPSITTVTTLQIPNNPQDTGGAFNT